MQKKKTLLEKIKQLESKVDSDDMFVKGVFGIMKFFNISYSDVMEMPIPAFNDCIKFIDDVNSPKNISGKRIGFKHG